jgi:hypothetical protein
MTRDLALLLALIGVGALFLLVHLALLARTVRAKKLPRAWRLLALIPPATPIAGWRAGARVLAVAWGVVAATYGVLRLLAS